MAQRLHNFIQSIWTEEQSPADLKDALTVAIHKKGDKADRGNYRGISLLSVVGKLFAKILSYRLTHIAEDVLPDTQCGFRPARGTIDREPKAFDSVHRETLWKILSKYGCPDKFIATIRVLHGDMTASVLCEGEQVEPFPVKVGVKQGYVIASMLFALFMGAVLQLAEPHLKNHGVKKTYRYNYGNMFNFWRLQAKTKVSTASIVKVQYTDDAAVCSTSKAGLQRITEAF